MNQKRVATIQDISGFGKCSLTVALPVLSAAGIETCVLPTAVLSTHTGGFSGYSYRDLTDDMLPFMEHWKSLDLSFDMIYTGYLGSARQLELVERFFTLFGHKSHILIDPAMADEGKLYRGFSPDFPRGMAKLCAHADVIVPNLTEAAFLLGRPCLEEGYTRADIEPMLRALGQLGPKQVVLSGVSFAPDEVGIAAYDSQSGHIDYYATPRVPGHYHGTGDTYASALCAALCHDYPLARAIAIAADFTLDAIVRTNRAGTDHRFGVAFEQSLPLLFSLLQDK